MLTTVFGSHESLAAMERQRQKRHSCQAMHCRSRLTDATWCHDATPADTLSLVVQVSEATKHSARTTRSMAVQKAVSPNAPRWVRSGNAKVATVARRMDATAPAR